MCKGVVLTLQNIEIMEDFLLLELGSTDVILGMQWLETLRGMQVNWKALTMKFRISGIAVTLQGDPSLSSSLVSLKAMLKALKKEREGMLVELGSLETSRVVVSIGIPAPFQAILQRFAGVFDWPKQLLPSRGRDHAITLLPGSAPVNVRPY